ncbi:MAG: class I SAM-dependent methyltransferase [Bacteroidales bacterium]|nr:class I SAM-dependent methyltransferase [Bacteroidales bacterium]
MSVSVLKIEHPSQDWKDYELLDSGRGEKLERFGSYILARPEPKALWDKTLSEKEWMSAAHTKFIPGAGFSKAGKEDSGSWNRLRRMDDRWQIRYPLSGGEKPMTMRLGLTSFKHVGIFPEQAPNWEYIFRNTSSLVAKAAGEGRPVPKVLNLFAYTGGASLAAKAAGADVTHLDSVRQVVTWAHENMDLSGLDGIRWIVEDAMKFVEREARRGNQYQGIILDPPAYGHGTDGEKWKLDECLFRMLRGVSSILAPKDSFMVLNLYSNGYSAALGETVVREAFGLKDGYSLEVGELALRDRFDKVLPLSVFERLRR